LKHGLDANRPGWRGKSGSLRYSVARPARGPEGVLIFRWGSPRRRRPGSRNKATLAAAALLAGESEALTRKAVELALAGDPTAMRLCIERLLPPCRERTVKFTLPPIESPPRHKPVG
jgi:hypothetical protein